jgi:hypothetical protein
MKNETKIILFLAAVCIVVGYSYYKQIPMSKAQERVLNYRVGSEELVSSNPRENMEFWKSPVGLNILSKISSCVSQKINFEKTTNIDATNICKKIFEECKSSKIISENKSDESCILKANGRPDVRLMDQLK